MLKSGSPSLEWAARIYIEDAARSGRPVECDEDQLQAPLLKEDSRRRQLDVAAKMGNDNGR